MKPIAIIVVVVIAAGALTLSYRSYREKSEGQLASRRADVEARESETRRRTAAEQEAQRLAALQAEQEAAAAERAIAELRAEQDAIAARRRATEAEAARMRAELEILRQETAKMLAEVKEFSTRRPTDLTLVETARDEALAKLKDLESERNELADRQAAHAAALARQQEIEQQALARIERYRASQAR